MINSIDSKTNKSSKLAFLKGQDTDLDNYLKELYIRIDNTCLILQKCSSFIHRAHLSNISREYKNTINTYLKKYSDKITQISFHNLMEIKRYIPFWIFYRYKIFNSLKEEINTNNLLKSAYDLVKDSSYRKYNNTNRFKEMLTKSLDGLINNLIIKISDNNIIVIKSYDIILTNEEELNFSKIIQLEEINDFDFVRCAISSIHFFALFNNDENFSIIQQTLMLCTDNYFFTNTEWKGLFSNSDCYKPHLEYLLKSITKKTLATNFIVMNNDLMNVIDT